MYLISVFNSIISTSINWDLFNHFHCLYKFFSQKKLMLNSLLQTQFAEMETREEHGNALLINGEDMLARCGEGQARSLKASLEKLKEKMYDTREKAERKR